MSGAVRGFIRRVFPLTSASFVMPESHTVSSVGVSSDRKAADRAIANGTAAECPPADGQSCERENAERDAADGETTYSHSSHCNNAEGKPANRNHAARTAADCNNSERGGPGSEYR